jgi:Arginase family
LRQVTRNIETFVVSLVSADIVPLSVGGDHSVSLPLLRAVGKDRPVGMIHIDAHCETNGSFEGCKFHHGGPFRQAVLDGVLDPERTVQIGIRGNARWRTNFRQVAVCMGSRRSGAQSGRGRSNTEASANLGAVEVLIAQPQSEHALADQRLDPVLDQLLTARVAEAGRKPVDETARSVGREAAGRRRPR